MTQPRILITGGTGFAGSHLVEYLLSQGFTDIHVTTLPDPSRERSDWLIPQDHIHQVNLVDQASVSELFKNLQPTQIYHLAAISEVGNSFKVADKVIVNNTLLQLSLLEAMREQTPKARMVIVGSAQEYDVHRSIPETGISEEHPLGPGNPYAVSKVTQDLLALSYFYSYDLDIVRARPFNHIGERQVAAFAVPSFAEQIAHVEQGSQDYIEIGNLSAIRDFTDVKDVVRAYAVLMEKGQKGEAYNIGSGKGVTMQEVLDQLIALATKPIEVRTDEARFRPQDAKKIIANVSKISQLGWEPSIPLAETLERVLNYARESI